jgi:hypothetical protein
VVFFRYELLRPWWCSAWASSSEWPARALISSCPGSIRSLGASICAFSSLLWMWKPRPKTDVFVKIPVSVQYHVIAAKVYEAFYKRANPRQEISSYLFNVILGHVPKMILDDAFLQQSDIAVAIKQGLDDVMRTEGYAIDQALGNRHSARRQG